MTNTINIKLIILVSALFLLPLVSFAQVGVGVDVNTNTTTDINVETDTGVEVDSNTGLDVEVNAEGETETEVGDEISLMVNSLGVAITSSSQVDSEEDLEVFSANASIRNRSVADVNINSESEGDNRVSVTYNHRAQFLGFIPVTLRSTTEVEARADGEAEVRSRLPWWSFLAKGTSDIKSNIESRVSNNNEVNANASVDASASARARVAEVIIAELDAYANAEADASVSN